MKRIFDDYGLTTTKLMSEEDAAKWRHDFNVYGQAFTKQVDGIDVYVPYESVYNIQPKSDHKMTDWNKRFIELAKHISTWSKDPSTKVGAVVVNENRVVIGMGYNGLPRGVKDLDSRLNDKELKRALVVHAELNAILNSNGSVRGCDLYVYPYPPCNECAKAIIQSGIKRIFCCNVQVSQKWAEAFTISEKMFQEAGVKVEFIEMLPSSGDKELYGR